MTPGCLASGASMTNGASMAGPQCQCGCCLANSAIMVGTACTDAYDDIMMWHFGGSQAYSNSTLVIRTFT